MLVNVNEEIVRTRLPELLKGFDCCKCDKCIGDMMAITLNNLHPAYVNTDQGILIKLICNKTVQAAADIDIEIIKAIHLVSKNPQHIFESDE